VTLLVFEVNTVERVERKYVVQIDTEKMEDLDDGDWKVRAEEMVRTGEVHKFTEGKELARRIQSRDRRAVTT
jgi:hypothetical protein